MSEKPTTRRRKAPSKQLLVARDTQPEQSPVPYDENILERARTQWQFGDWQSLAQLDRDTLQHHPDRATLALLAAAGRLQTGQDTEARQYIRLAQDWGVSKKLISQILIAGVHNSIGRAAAIGNQPHRAQQHFKNVIASGMLGDDENLLSQVKLIGQVEQIDLRGHFSIEELPVATAHRNYHGLIGIVSGYYPGMRFNSQVNHRLYAKQHGYRYIFDNTPRFDRRTYMRKLEAILEYLDLFDWLFWIDDDAYITDFSIPLERFIDMAPDSDFIVCKSPSTKDVFTKISSGQFLLRNTVKARRFVEEALATDLHIVQKWWKSHLGMFTKGDQDALVYLIETRPDYAHTFCSILDHFHFNNRPFEYKRRLDEHFLVHFAGKQKMRDKAVFCERLQCNEYLCPSNLIDEISLR